MAVAFRANGHAQVAANSTLTATLPAGLTAGDFMVMAVTAAGTGGTVTVNTPAGWTAASSSPSALGGSLGRQIFYVFTRTAGASESAPTVTTSASANYMVDIMAFTGVAASGALDANAVAAWKGASSDKNYTFASVTTTHANDGILILIDTNENTQSVNAPVFSSGPGGFSFAAVTAQSDQTANTMTAALGSQAATGATGTMACSYTASFAFDAAGFTLALSPPPSGAVGRTSAPGQAVAAMVAARNIERKAERKTGQQQTPQRFSRVLDAYLHRRGH